MIRKDTDKLISFKFFSLGDFYNSVNNVIGSTGIGRDHERDCKRGELTRFNGASYGEIMDRKYSWPEGVSELMELESLDKIVSKQWHKIWNEDDGDDMDMERYYNDLPFMQKRIKTLGNKSRSNRIQKILINITERAGVSAEKLLWKTFTAVKLCDELESQNIRCEVVLFEKARKIDNKSRTVFVEIPIKQADEPINTSLLCSVLSPWFFRYWIFQLELNSIERVCGSLGTPAKINEQDVPDIENCIVIDSGTALSKDAANEFLTTAREVK